MRHSTTLRIGPATFRIGADHAAPVAALRQLYAGYPKPDDIADFTVRLPAVSTLRRTIRPSIRIDGDYALADAAPLPLAQGLLAAEMGMNLQMALGWRRHLLLHASSVEKDGRALVMTGASGSGKSTLAAMLGEQGWRLMGDEFALLDLESGAMWPFPRLVSLKNSGIAAMEALAPADRFGPLMPGTPKGDIRHLIPNAGAIAGMDRPAMPALLLFPRFGHEAVVRDIAAGEVFIRLTQASTNYVALGEAGFEALTAFVRDVPARAIDFNNGNEAIEIVNNLWDKLP